MSENPISPPPLVSPPPASSTADPGPISPIGGRAAAFEHKTSGAVPPTRPFIGTDTPSINDKPVELDGVPTSPDALKRRTTDEAEKKLISPGLGEEEDINEEFLGEGEQGLSKSVREKRAAMLASRSKDPGVIVDVPQDPTAEEVEAAKSAEGTVTPGIPVDEGQQIQGTR